MKKKSLFLWATALLILAGFVGVYAILPNVPNPGHAISELQGCESADQILKWTGSAWGCVVPIDTTCATSGTCSQVCIGTNCQTSWSSGSSLWQGTEDIYYTAGKVSIGYVSSGGYDLAVNGNLYVGNGFGYFSEGIFLGTTYTTCDEDHTGMLRYREDSCDGSVYHSYFEICVKSGVDTYVWNIIKENSYGSCSVSSTGDGGGGGSCFLSGTKVLMSDESLKNIEEIKQGESVLSFDEESQKLVKSEVKELLVHTEKNTDNWENKYFILTTLSKNEIRVTGNHPIYILKEGNTKYVQVNKLQVGDIVLVSSEKETHFEEILFIEVIEIDPKVVYNLHLNKPNNYFAEGILVHNLKAVDPSCLGGIC